MPSQILIAALLVLLPIYYLTVRPYLRLSELRSRATRDGGTRIPIKLSVASAPMPMVKYRNRLFPRLYLYDDRIEYYILTNKVVPFAKIDALELGNRSMFTYTLTVLTGGGEDTTTTVFSMTPESAEQCWQLLRDRCDIEDKRIPWS